MSILIFLIISYILLSFFLMKVFKKADRDPQKALIPGVNFMEWCDIVGRPKWHAIWLLVPLVNIFFFCYLAVEMTRSFGRYDFVNTALAVVYAPAEMYLIGKGVDRYQEPNWAAEKKYKEAVAAAYKSGSKIEAQKLERQNKYKKSAAREWFESLFFAVFAAALIRMFLIEAYTIPTPSMEGSLLVGDYLFVSKAHYGLRTPSTILQVPLLHNRLPGNRGESYLKKPNLPFYRFPALESLDKGDPVVFNWPVGDSVYITPQRSWAVGQIERNPNIMAQDRSLARMVKNQDFITRPIDKKDHYIKRCVGTPGDTLQIMNRQIYINREVQEQPEHVQFQTLVNFSGGFNYKLLEDWGIDVDQDIIGPRNNDHFMAHLDPEERAKLDAIDGVTTTVVSSYYTPVLSQETMDTLVSLGIKPGQRTRLSNGLQGLMLTHEQYIGLKRIGSNIQPLRGPRDLFPHDPAIIDGWSVDNFGPIYIPKAGVTTPLNKDILPFYERVINVYENHDLELRGDKIFIDGKEVTDYTFEQDYYWMMGDNRHASEDSRMWGYVPADHIVGKPLFIFMSAPRGNPANGVRWDRVFTSANK